ncbi:MAG: hypothetical protein ACLUFP_00340 [Streptococcus salivarius]
MNLNVELGWDTEKIRTFAYEQNMSLLDASANIMLSPIKGKQLRAFTILLT